MTLLAFTMTHRNGIRVAEVGALLGLIGGVALLLGGLTPFGKRMGQTIGGLCLAIGFALLIVAIHYGLFR